MKFVFTALAAAFAGTTAFAGGYAPPAVEQPVVAPIAPVAPVETGSDWTGGYVGLQYGKGDLKLDIPASVVGGAISGISGEADINAYGVHAGYQHDFEKFVLGGELDYNKLDVDDIVLSAKSESENFGSAKDDMWRLRGRAGYDAGKFLPYVTLGVANALDETGFSYGVGADFKVTETLTLGAEYSRQSFKDIAGIKGPEADINLIQVRGAFHF